MLAVSETICIRDSENFYFKARIYDIIPISLIIFSESLKGGKKSNGSKEQKVDMLVRCQPCQKIFASMDTYRAHQRVIYLRGYFLVQFKDFITKSGTLLEQKYLQIQVNFSFRARNV